MPNQLGLALQRGSWCGLRLVPYDFKFFTFTVTRLSISIAISVYFNVLVVCFVTAEATTGRYIYEKRFS